jgi:hypothetical protein
MAGDEAQATVVVVLASAAVDEELVSEDATGVASIVRIEERRTRRTAIDEIFFFILARKTIALYICVVGK